MNILPSFWNCFVESFHKNIRRAKKPGKRNGPRRSYHRGPYQVLAAIYFRGTYRPTIIDAPMFHFRVRDGTGWDHWAMTTRLRFTALLSCSALRHSCCGVRHTVCPGVTSFTLSRCCRGCCDTFVSSGRLTYAGELVFFFLRESCFSRKSFSIAVLALLKADTRGFRKACVRSYLACSSIGC